MEKKKSHIYEKELYQGENAQRHERKSIRL